MYRNSSTVEKPKGALLVGNMDEKINTRITANSTSLMEPLQRGFDYHSGANSDLKQMVMHQSTRTLPTKRTATNADY